MQQNISHMKCKIVCGNKWKCVSDHIQRFQRTWFSSQITQCFRVSVVPSSLACIYHLRLQLFTSTAHWLPCMTPYCLQRDSASSIKHNAPKQILQCLVSFREQHHTYVTSFGIMASQPSNFQFWLLKNSLFFQA